MDVYPFKMHLKTYSSAVKFQGTDFFLWLIFVLCKVNDTDIGTNYTRGIGLKLNCIKYALNGFSYCMCSFSENFSRDRYIKILRKSAKSI